MYLLASQLHIPLLLLPDPLDEPFLELCVCNFAASSPPPLATLLPPAEVVSSNAVLLGNVGYGGLAYLLDQELFGLFAEDLIAIGAAPLQSKTGLLASLAQLDLIREVP